MFRTNMHAVKCLVIQVLKVVALYIIFANYDVSTKHLGMFCGNAV